MKNNEKFKDFCLKVVILNNGSYEQYWTLSNFDDRIVECIANFTKTFGKSFFEMNSSEINKLDFNLEPFKSYSDKQGSGIPKSIINKHYRLFLEFDKKMKFNDLQDLINFVHQTFQKEKIYKNSYFINTFQKERIRLNGNSKVPSSNKIFGNVRQNHWTINIGAEKELQYHINIDKSQIHYGLGFNAQSSKNNTDPLSCVQPFVDSFFRNESLISGHLKGYSTDRIKDKLKSIKVGDFCLLEKSIEINNLDNGFEMEGLALLEMLYNLANRQFEAYKTIFQSSKNNFNEIKNSDMENKINLLKYKKQIILQGPPGTGKTREAKELAKELLNIEEKENLKSNKRFQIIQFHPSYSYEDFVRGIVAKPNSNGDGITYEAENKVLTEFAENAEKDSNSNYVLIIDEINRANLSSVLGELIYALEYRGEAVDSMYAVDGSNKITLPPNLYIIGTMNTADRSVGHIDYAIRRRFAFVDVLPRDLSKNSDIKFEKEKFTEVSELFIKNFDLSKDYSKEKIEKSDYLSNEFDVKDVWLGHSYFIEQYEKDNNGEDIKDKPIDFRIRLEYEIKPILREYVKDGVLKELAINEINKL